MSPVTANLVGALLFLVMGVAEYLVFLRAAYPAMRDRHEAAKVTQTQGSDPSWISTIVRLQCFVLMPVLGYFIGGNIVHSLMGSN